MEFKRTKAQQRAEEYAKEKSSSNVFKESHINDFLAGYNQAIKDLKASELLKMLTYLDRRGGLGLETHREIQQLIKEATEL